jgi:hypothetical protein
MADDRFESYYTEKLWEQIPAIYRTEDGLALPPGVLRGIVTLLAQQAARVRRSQDRLWEDQFIELCDDWAVPYIGDLLGTRMVSVLDRPGRRADVAKTIYYRRRSGTLAVLEELIADITRFEGTVVEELRRLLRTPHLLEPAPGARAGHFTGTLPGGLPDLRRPRGAELAGGPFDELSWTLDTRKHHGGEAGRYNIPKLGFHLYRLTAYQVTGVVPAAVGADGRNFLFDPSGRDVPLFQRASRGAADRQARFSDWRRAREWELPARMRCRVLGDAQYQVDEAQVRALALGGAADAQLRTLIGVPFRDEASLRVRVQALPAVAALLTPGLWLKLVRGALIDECGKKALYPFSVAVDEPAAAAPPVTVPVESVTAASLAAWAVTTGKHLAIDPELGRCRFVDAAPLDPAAVRVAYHYGFSGPVGAGSYDRAAQLDKDIPAADRRSGGGALTAASVPSLAIPADRPSQLDDSATYGPIDSVSGITALALQAQDRTRPFVRLAADWVLTGAGPDATLRLDGLWLGGKGDVVLKGQFKSVALRSCTLDPGGTAAGGTPIPPVRLVVQAQVQELSIQGCVSGPLVTGAGGALETVEIADSIVQALDPSKAKALDLSSGFVTARRVTIFGAAHVHKLDASEVLAAGLALVDDTQDGCFRFGAAPPGSVLPHPYRRVELADANHLFTSRLFGQPGYGQLSETAGEELLRGAENGSEIGAFSALVNPIKLDSLWVKVGEFMPFGLVPVFLLET